MKPISGILVRKISDHLPIFCSLPINLKKLIDTPKFVWKTKNSQISLNNLKRELETINWNDEISLNHDSNANIGYDCFINKLKLLTNKHMPLEKVRFNKYKDKINPWVTNGILNSIRHKDYLYKKWIEHQM